MGNWKMNPQTAAEAITIGKKVSKVALTTKKVMTVMCPPALYFASVKKFVDDKNTFAGVQNIFTEERGSYTGEVSIDMIKDAGAKFAIIGHSERRKMGESDEMVNKKVHLALSKKITPIVCIGETTRDEEGKYLGFIKEQLSKGLARVPTDDFTKVIIAYEPVWAIGASTAMNSHDVHQMTIFITKALIDLFRVKRQEPVPILYGGAVDPTNAYSILTDGNADGLLIGRQSLDPEAFSDILRIANSC